MSRVACFLLVADLLACLSAAAPVPKGPPPKPGLTPDAVVGTFDYSWGQWPDGRITFDKDGSYYARHTPDGPTVYAGSWKVEGNTLTITEWSYSAATGGLGGGPIDYAFDFGETRLPALAGVSNGHTRVSLTRPDRN
jgi:hypothetical protein